MFKFSIRDVLWLTLVAAVALGWFVHYRASESRHESHCLALESRYEKRSEYIEKLKAQLRWTIGERNALIEIRESRGQAASIVTVPGDLPPDLENEPAPPERQN